MFKDKKLANEREWATKHEFHVMECPNCKHNTLFTKRVIKTLYNLATGKARDEDISSYNSMIPQGILTPYSFYMAYLQCLNCGKYFEKKKSESWVEVEIRGEETSNV